MAETYRSLVMSTILKEFEFRKGSNGASKHPWATWLDGRIHRLEKEDMGEASLRTLVVVFHRKAKAMGKKVRLSVDREACTIVCQAYVPEADEVTANGAANGSKKGSKGNRSRKGGK
jgi:hypothetical protein